MRVVGCARLLGAARLREVIAVTVVKAPLAVPTAVHIQTSAQACDLPPDHILADDPDDAVPIGRAVEEYESRPDVGGGGPPADDPADQEGPAIPVDAPVWSAVIQTGTWGRIILYLIVVVLS